jgi:hypothetical protein
MRQDGHRRKFNKGEGARHSQRGRARRICRSAFLGLALLALSACAGHKDLTAPCDATDNGGLFGRLQAFGRAFACEPMRRISAIDAEAINGVH